VKAGSPERIVAISTYSATTDKHADYSEGAYSGSVAISADASKLAFPPARPREGAAEDNHLHIIDLKTGKETLGPEVSHSNWPVYISWSPDSRRLVYSVTGKIRVWDSDTSRVWEIADGDVAAWSPSGEWIAYLQGTWETALNRVIFLPGRWGPRCLVVHPDGTGGKTLIELPRKRNLTPILVEPPTWSPDSSSILLNELWDVDTGTVNVLILDLKTMKLRMVFHNSLRVLGWAEAN
jgi:WD40 repeat protein